MKKIILVKYGEISLKGRNRYLFEAALIENIKLGTGLKSSQIRNHYGRIYIYLEENAPNAIYLKALKNIFGIVDATLAYELPLSYDLEPLKQVVRDLLKPVLFSSATFKIDTRRTHKNFPLDSMQVNAALGGVVLDQFPNWKVNLNDPQMAICVEIREEGIFTYLDDSAEKGVGGLPVGVSGKGLLLLSGGIDSPVAGWSMMKRGMSIDAIHFHSFPYTGEKAKEKAIDLAKALVKWKHRPIQLFIPNFTPIQEIINQQCPEGAWTILHRRFMLRIAEKIGRYDALITGDNLGQVASQTIQNMSVIGQATRLPILRPLIAFDKQEIIVKAKQLDTYRISNRPFEDCCTVFAPKNPATKARESEILMAEQLLPVEELITNAIEKTEIIKLGLE